MTLASKITLVRVAMIPVYMVFMYLSGGNPGLWMWLGLGVFILATDTVILHQIDSNATKILKLVNVFSSKA